MAEGRRAKISVQSIKAVADDTVVQNRNKSIQCMLKIENDLSKIPGVWICPTGEAFVGKVQKQQETSWQAPIKLLDRYIEKLRIVAANYESAEASNQGNQQSDRDRYRSRKGGGGR